ncbi:ATP-binding cassette domain-containing protein [Blastococcus sp. VKM Ac-2987]|uniref:ATP-binding cassette domain-containing protein n=1 Tax=Blastococcus sp. VKM Ac-2987 TaxID=3004141 RepID=UPI0022AB5242|nr:ATP-binding cassette domain-containing protein [Blastococcus sp. VKM Ac-2987]MCZ2857878.1 ATP-binding cassette domain-containing protein [Blastococcus sp. VKM Ac-2987]
MNPTAAISVRGLRKSFGDHVVLDGLDLTVPEGSVFALLGPNGSGKTTTVDILATLTPPDGGEVRIAGSDVVREPRAVRSAIAVTGQFTAVDNLLTGAENLRLVADLLHLGRRTGTARAAELLDRFDLTEAAATSPTTYSGGMRRKLDLAMGLMGEPRVVFLDEPTTGLDPRSRRAVWDVVRGLVADGVTVLLTTQYLEEADQLADRIGVLDGGRLVAEGTSAELKRLVPGGSLRLQFTDRRPLDAAARVLRGATVDADALALEVPSDGSVRALRDVLARLDDAAAEVANLTVHQPDLDDVFLALTGRTTDEKVTTP